MLIGHFNADHHLIEERVIAEDSDKIDPPIVCAAGDWVVVAISGQRFGPLKEGTLTRVTKW